MNVTKSTKSKRGGAREGAGRKGIAEGVESVQINIRSTPHQKDKFLALGGAEWFRQAVDRAKVPNEDAPSVRVGSQVSRRWRRLLNADVLQSDAERYAGKLCIAMCCKADELIAQMDDTDAVELINKATVRQCNVWTFD